MFEISRPNPPRIILDGIHDDEKDLVWKIITNFIFLRNQVDEFEAAVRLIDAYEPEAAKLEQARNESGPSDPLAMQTWIDMVRNTTEQSTLISHWMRIAARDATIRVWDFRKALGYVISETAAATKFKSVMDFEALETAASDFDRKLFPKATVIRNSVAHRSELSDNADKNGANRPYASDGLNIAKGARNIFLDVLNGRTLVMTRKQEIIECEITWESVSKLDQTLDKIFGAFKAAEDSTRLYAQESIATVGNKK